MSDKKKLWDGPHHGTNNQGKNVTVSFGEKGTTKEGETLISDGHKSSSDFFGDSKSTKGHDHYNGKGGGTDRGQYTGEGSK